MPFHRTGGRTDHRHGWSQGEKADRLGVETLADVAEVDPLQALGPVPSFKLREFRAKARLVLGLRIDLVPFATLADRSIGSLLVESPLDLIAALSGVTLDEITRLQDWLAILEVALDQTQLHQVTLGELFNT